MIIKRQQRSSYAKSIDSKKNYVFTNVVIKFEYLELLYETKSLTKIKLVQAFG